MSAPETLPPAAPPAPGAPGAPAPGFLGAGRCSKKKDQPMSTAMERPTANNRFLSMMGDGVVAAVGEGMAAEQAPQREDGAGERAAR